MSSLDDLPGLHRVDTRCEPQKPARPQFLPRNPPRREPLDVFEVVGVISAAVGIAVLCGLLAGLLG